MIKLKVDFIFPAGFGGNLTDQEALEEMKEIVEEARVVGGYGTISIDRLGGPPLSITLEAPAPTPPEPNLDKP